MVKFTPGSVQSWEKARVEWCCRSLRTPMASFMESPTIESKLNLIRNGTQKQQQEERGNNAAKLVERVLLP